MRPLLTQEALEAGADAVHKMAVEAGFGAFINRDQERALAAAVIRRVDTQREVEGR